MYGQVASSSHFGDRYRCGLIREDGIPKPALEHLAAVEHAAKVMPKGRNFH